MSRPLLLILVSCFLITSCGHNSISVVPYPNEVTFERGYFDSSSSSVYAVGLDSLSVINVKEFAQMLKTEFMRSGRFLDMGLPLYIVKMLMMRPIILISGEKP